jgi:hypothetical protein
MRNNKQNAMVDMSFQFALEINARCCTLYFQID